MEENKQASLEQPSQDQPTATETPTAEPKTRGITAGWSKGVVAVLIMEGEEVVDQYPMSPTVADTLSVTLRKSAKKARKP